MKHILLTLGLATLLAATARADGIPEPGILYYGAITNSANGNARLTNSANTLIWTVQGPNNTAWAIVSPLQNISNRWSFRFRVPFESLEGGNTLSAGAFALTGSDTFYTNSLVQISSGGNLFTANIQGFPNLTVSHNKDKRGQVKEVNLTVNALSVQSVGGGGTQPPGRTNVVAQVGGLPPSFQFTYVAPHPAGGYYLEWIGAPTNKSYYLLRSQSVATPAERQEVVHLFQPSTTPVNFYSDTNVVNTTTYFYRLISP